ncbi:MAG: serine/threonine-protein phosphatase [Pirellulales bacterium]|nr:serine/threonine-protein phosphatase [Pirellulales bacterium]
MQKAVTWDNSVEVAVLSDIGMRRTNNQDSYAVVTAPNEQKWHERGHLLLVADGMGAHAAGELASKLAADNVPLTYDKLRDLPLAEALRRAVEDANQKIHSRGEANVDFHGMGTTNTSLLLTPEGAIVAHVGDSRVYRLRGDVLDQLSFDHSLVWEMMAGGKLSEREVPSYIPRNIITRSLGPSPEVKVDVEGPLPIEVGDIYLLCSDGLTGQVRDEELGVILSCLSPSEAVRALVDLANLRGGPDNITVIVAKISGEHGHGGGGAPRHASAKSSSGRGSLATWLWATAGLLALAALGLGAAAQVVPAIMSGAMAAIVAAVALSLRSGEHRASEPPPPMPRQGAAPYTTRHCVADATFVSELATLAEQLRQAATEENWKLDRATFESRCEIAKNAAAAGDAQRAVREYCLAVSFIMGELRAQSSRHPGETNAQ